MQKFILGFSIIFFLVSCKKEDVSLQDINNPTTGTNTSSFNVDANLMLQLVNNIRKSGCNCGTTAMPPVNTVTWNDKLALAAYNHSKDMNNLDYFSHTGEDGSNPGTRITNAGYSWRAYGENIAVGYAHEQAVMTGWLNSEGHCKNIMNANFKEMGVGREADYWTQEFGAR